MDRKLLLKCLGVTFVTAIFTLIINNAQLSMTSGDDGNYALLNFVIYFEYYFSGLSLSFATIAGNKLGKCKTDDEFMETHKKLSGTYNSYYLLTILIKLIATEIIVVPLYDDAIMVRLCVITAIVCHLPKRVYSETVWYVYKFKLDRMNTNLSLYTKFTYFTAVVCAYVLNINSIYLIIFFTYFDCIGNLVGHSIVLKHTMNKADFKVKYYLVRQDFRGVKDSLKDVLPEAIRLLSGFAETYISTFAITRLLGVEQDTYWLWYAIGLELTDQHSSFTPVFYGAVLREFDKFKCNRKEYHKQFWVYIKSTAVYYAVALPAFLYCYRDYFTVTVMLLGVFMSILSWVGNYYLSVGVKTLEKQKQYTRAYIGSLVLLGVLVLLNEGLVWLLVAKILSKIYRVYRSYILTFKGE